METAAALQTAVWAVVDDDNDVLDLTGDEVQHRVETRLQSHRRHGSQHKVPVVIVDNDDDDDDDDDEAERHESQPEI